jgi:hypothetical protein
MKAHLFLCMDNGHYAVSRDKDGSTLPRQECAGGWRFVRTLDVEVNQPLPLNVDPEPILRALNADGYFVLSADGAPHATSQ